MWHATGISPWDSSVHYIFINDLPNVSSLTHSLLFADDTNIFCSHRILTTLFSLLTMNLQKYLLGLKRISHLTI